MMVHVLRSVVAFFVFLLSCIACSFVRLLVARLTLVQCMTRVVVVGQSFLLLRSTSKGRYVSFVLLMLRLVPSDLS